VTVNGDLTVTGTQTYLNTENVTVKDPAILLGNANTGDSIQLGVQLQYKTGSNTLYAGMKRIPATGEMVFFKDSSVTVENSTSDTYATVVADSFNSASDARLKKDIVQLEGALDKIDAMRGVSYNWINPTQSEDRQVGVIAQEIQSVYPELVTEGGNGYLSVDYPKLTAVLLQSVKELKAMVLALANK
jgi:hypothetical protein